MSRSKWKGSYVNLKFIKQRNLENLQKSSISIISRSSEIVPAFVGLTFNVYNGKNYVEITVTDEMTGYKFGEFSYTRSKFAFKKKDKKK
jgi:small subunit ribosomal protein S19